MARLCKCEDFFFIYLFILAPSLYRYTNIQLFAHQCAVPLSLRFNVKLILNASPHVWIHLCSVYSCVCAHIRVAVCIQSWHHQLVWYEKQHHLITIHQSHDPQHHYRDWHPSHARVKHQRGGNNCSEELKYSSRTSPFFPPFLCAVMDPWRIFLYCCVSYSCPVFILLMEWSLVCILSRWHWSGG